MLSAPPAGLVHLGDVATNLAAAVTEPEYIAVDSSSAGLKSALAFCSMISVSEQRATKPDDQPSDHHCAQRQSNPDTLVHHDRLRQSRYFPLIRIQCGRSGINIIAAVKTALLLNREHISIGSESARAECGSDGQAN
jgi:hypothetical protein